MAWRCGRTEAGDVGDWTICGETVHLSAPSVRQPVDMPMSAIGISFPTRTELPLRRELLKPQS